MSLLKCFETHNVVQSFELVELVTVLPFQSVTLTVQTISHMKDISWTDQSQTESINIENTRCVVNATNAKHAAKVFTPCLIFSKFKGDNCQKSLDQNNINLIKVREWKLKISYFFVISRGITVKNQHTITKFKLDLRIPLTYDLHMQFQPYSPAEFGGTLKCCL
jgi:hypothetical protein